MSPPMVALIYVTEIQGADVRQVVAGRLRLVDGRVVGDPTDDPSMQFVLGRPLWQPDGSWLTARDHPREFLAALRWAYSGSMLRVGLMPETPGKNPVSRGESREAASGKVAKNWSRRSDLNR